MGLELRPRAPMAASIPLLFYCHLSACIHSQSFRPLLLSLLWPPSGPTAALLDGVLRAAARMIGGVPRFGHISEFMRDTLHWLPVRQRIRYRLSTIVWRCALGIAPTYLLELFILTSSCTGRQYLRFASRGDFVVTHARTAIKQHRAFSIVGPSLWNSLPPEICSLPRDLSSLFYKLLKTFIFARAWAGSASE